jgi:hypothetical protein
MSARELPPVGPATPCGDSAPPAPGTPGAQSRWTLVPASRDASGNVTVHPERLEVAPVDEYLFQLITAGDTFVNGTCVVCGFGAALFVCAGRFVSLCPFCTVGRIEEYRAIGADPVEPAWIGVLDREARKESAFQIRKEEQAYTVTLDDVWKCARCGALIRAEEARYHHPPGENSSPPYCESCGEALRAGGEGGA